MGLNPHAGEGGLLGDEDISIIAPGIAPVRADGITRPLVAATPRSARPERPVRYVVAQYHDQGLIPVKHIGFDEAVNATLGLPIVRTIPDHGTAFDIAGSGVADSSSLETAFDYALRLEASRANQKADTP